MRQKQRRRTIRRTDKQSGFSLIELMVVVTILGILLTLATLNWAGISRENSLASGVKQVEAAMKRAKTLASQENITYILKLMPHSDPTHPDTYGFFRSGQTEPEVSKSVAGEDNQSGYIALENGVRINGSSVISITFAPAGTTISVSPARSVELSFGGANRSVSISSSGKITL